MVSGWLHRRRGGYKLATMDFATFEGVPELPLVATAIHHGHDVRPEVGELLAIDAATRLREEDPRTGALTTVAPARVVVHRSRFEVDLNRPRDRAVYRTPADAWGLEAWREPPPDELVAESLRLYDDWYRRMHDLLSDTARRHGGFVLLDVHSYNHRREGPGAAAADLLDNPEVNVGTGSMDRDRWAPVVDGFMKALRAHGGLDVRENVRFRGGHLSRWVHESFPATGCALALEFKKTWIDEWTVEVDDDHHDRLVAALRHAVPGTLAALPV